MKKKKALIIAYNDLNNSGVPNVIYQTITSLHDEYDFDIITFSDNNYYFDKLNEKGIHNIKIINFAECNSKINKFISYLFRKKLYKKAIQFLSKNKYDVVHSFKEYDSWPFLKACKKFNIKKRIIHCNVIHETSRNFLIRLVSNRDKRLTLKYASDFVGVSKQCCEKAFNGKKYTIVYNSYNEFLFSNVKNMLNTEELILTQIGAFNSNKNQLFSLSILIELKKLFQNARLKLIGRETEAGYLNQIIDFINNNNLDTSVEIINGEKGVGNHLSYTTFVLLPSKKEGAGIVAIEAQACGIKVFASSNVSDEMNAGGLFRLDLNKKPTIWARAIYNEFIKNHNNREKYNLERFSNENFSKAIHSIYIS